MAKVVIMPIHTKYLDLILDGAKRVEFRKRAVRPEVEWILFYENKTGKITAKAKILAAGSYPVDVIYETRPIMTNNGVTKDELLAYAGRNSEVICIWVIYAKLLDTPLTLADVGLTHAPQGYVYREMEVPK